MRILFYNEIQPEEIPELEKVIHFLMNDDFRSADVKKLDNTLYCARLNRADRLLFTLYKSGQHTYALILEHIKNHAYEKSRFLKRGVKVNEDLIPSLDIEHIHNDSLETLPHLKSQEQQTSHFHLLQKPITFDAAQQRIYDLPEPIIIIGTAGSGKTLLLLEKMKHLNGNILYITQSSYLAHHSQNLYYANQYSSKQQITTFLSFQDFLDSIAVPSGKAVTYSNFRDWFAKHLAATPIKDGRALFEEFRGVITGSNIDSAYLSRSAYLALGVKETIFADNQRNDVYGLFERYLDYLAEHELYDHNMASYDYLSLTKKHYDYVVVDEVQDFSVIQLHLIMSSLIQPDHFLLCGDANQVVYPNFFSWAKTKSLFFTALFTKLPNDSPAITQILNTNYRNSISIIDLANKLLRMKNWRFGSIDKDSHHEMKSLGVETGSISFLSSNQETLRDIDHKTRASKQFAVIVLYDEMKPVAAKYFHTPLIFSIQECKGLEYENVILFNMVSNASQNFHEIALGVTTDILNNPVRYARNKDKTDKSLEKYKFFINALFVAITRAQVNLYWIEEKADHPLLNLFRHDESQGTTTHIEHHASSQEEWQQEASMLDQQGKSAQAQHIREAILQQQNPPWEVIAGGGIDRLFDAALEHREKKAKLALFEYALVYEDHHARNELISIGFGPALHPEDGMQKLLIKYFMMYQQEQLGAIKRQMAKYGVDFRNTFNQTPLMIGAWLGSEPIIQLANSLNADPFLANNKGFNAYQIALEQACLHNYYATDKLQAVYSLLRPETLSIRIDNQLSVLGQHQAEFFLIHLMIALFYRILPENMVLSNGAYSANNIVQAIEHWPQGLLPKELHDSVYINKVLSNNQVPQDLHLATNLPLFIQVSPDNYLLNPDIKLQAEGEWLYVYDILYFDDLAIGYQDSQTEFDANPLYKNLLSNKINDYKRSMGIY
ncbi:MAG: AAA family ATPase [Thiotrichaceae bacterium]